LETELTTARRELEEAKGAQADAIRIERYLIDEEAPAHPYSPNLSLANQVMHYCDSLRRQLEEVQQWIDSDPDWKSQYMQIAEQKERALIDKYNNNKPANSRLTIFKLNKMVYSKAGNGVRLVDCLCICGLITTIRLGNFTSGTTLSCGCINEERKPSNNVVALRKVFAGMKKRCYQRNSMHYKYYGLLGVRICDEWLADKNLFIDWALANGYKKGLFLDKDIKGGGKLYSPSHCCWVTRSQNLNYTKRSIKYEYNGCFYSIKGLSNLVGIPYKALFNRIKYKGMTVKNAIETPNTGKATQ